MSSRFGWFITGSAALAIIGCLLTWFYLSESKASARDATTNLLRMKQLNRQIVELRQLNLNAHLAGEQPIESSSSWVEYGREAGITESQVIEINRLPIQSIKKSAYSHDQVFIRLADVTVEQVVQLLLGCRDARIGYSPVSVHLAARPGKSGETEKWGVDLVLTRLLYTAKNAP